MDRTVLQPAAVPVSFQPVTAADEPIAPLVAPVPAVQLVQVLADLTPSFPVPV